jgi:hypothetical protein
MNLASDFTRVNTSAYVTAYVSIRQHPFNRENECPAHAMCYTYQTPTAKPVFMAEKTVSVMELIANGHAVAVPHDAGVHTKRG